MRANHIVQWVSLFAGAFVSMCLAMYYAVSWEDSVALFVGDELDAFGGPALIGLSLGTAIAAVIGKLESQRFRLYYVPLIFLLMSLAPIVIVTLVMNLGPT